MSTANLTYPVNVGPVKNIKVSRSLKLVKATLLSPLAENSTSHFREASEYSESKYLQEGQNKFDVGLMLYSIDGKGMVFNINNID